MSQLVHNKRLRSYFGLILSKKISSIIHSILQKVLKRCKKCNPLESTHSPPQLIPLLKLALGWLCVYCCTGFGKSNHIKVLITNIFFKSHIVFGLILIHSVMLF